ncbi:MAG TPA: hypothetical protein VF789_32275 [Thermoanaerobaculia bacterium]
MSFMKAPLVFARAASPIDIQSALASLARLKGGKGHFAAFDQPLGPPEKPLAATGRQAGGGTR